MEITHIVEILNYTNGQAPHVAFHASTDDIHELKDIHGELPGLESPGFRIRSIRNV